MKRNLIKELIMDEYEAIQSDLENTRDCESCQMCEPGDRYCFIDFMNNTMEE